MLFSRGQCRRFANASFSACSSHGLLQSALRDRLAVQALVAFGAITPVISGVNSLVLLGVALGLWLGGSWVGPLVRRPGSRLFSSLPAVAPDGSRRAGRAGSVHAGHDLLIRLPTLRFLHLCRAGDSVDGSHDPAIRVFNGRHFSADDGRRRHRFWRALSRQLPRRTRRSGLAAAYVLIELNGLRGTLFIAAELNVVAALIAVLLAMRPEDKARAAGPPVKGRGARLRGWRVEAGLAVGFFRVWNAGGLGQAFDPDSWHDDLWPRASLLMLYLGKLAGRLDLPAALVPPGAIFRARRDSSLRGVPFFKQFSSITVWKLGAPEWRRGSFRCAPPRLCRSVSDRGGPKRLPAARPNRSDVSAFSVVAGCVIGPLVAVYGFCLL